MEGATVRQSEILAYIRDYINKYSYSPTVREIANNFSISVKGAQDFVQALKRKGYIDLQQRRSRTIRILEKGAADASN